MKKPTDTILIVDDQPEILNSLERLLKSNFNILLASNGVEALDILKKNAVSVILTDQRMPKMTGVEFLMESLTLQPDAVRILITAYADIDASIAAINKGHIYYYISKPWEPEELLLIVRRAAEHFHLQEENERLTQELMEANKKLEQENVLLKRNFEKTYDFQNIVGNSPKMLQLFKLISKILDTRTTVLISGDTGTGKEMLARAIHTNGLRKNEMFIAQNCGALPDTLLESELFGHVKGAFTGAVYDKKGLFEMADKGTIFLDEIGDTSPAMQMRLLRVLQEGEIKPVGGSKIKKVDVRIIAATNKNLETLVKEKKFREDLYYRLHVFPIHLPPLRERREDIPDLVAHFIKKYSKEMKKRIVSIHPDALKVLIKADLPGNIRELENEIERAVTLAEPDSSIALDQLSPRFRNGTQTLLPKATDSLKDQVEELEIYLIREALRQTQGNILRAAEKLQISRAGLHKKLTRYRIDPH